MQHNQNHHNRNRTIGEHFATLLLASFPQLGEKLETTRHTLEGFAPYVMQFFQWLQEQPAKNRESLIKLAKIGWFPDLGMPLDNLSEIMHVVSYDSNHAQTIAINFLRERVDAIERELSKSYPNRSRLFRDAFEAHRERKYSLSIPVFLAQSDGIFKERLSKQLFIETERKSASEQAISQHDPEGFLAPMLCALSISTPLWMSKKDRHKWMMGHGYESSFIELNRHLVLHGVSVDYDTEKHSLQAISLLSYLRCVVDLFRVEEYRD